MVPNQPKSKAPPTHMRDLALTSPPPFTIHTHTHTHTHARKGGSDKRGHHRILQKFPKSVVLSELGVISVEKWQREWDKTTKGAITKEYFPVVTERLKMKINISQNFITMVTGHGNIRSYLHRFKISETPICPCGTTDQTIDHLLFQCELLNKERNNLMSTELKTNVWPISKDKLIRKHLKYLLNSLTKYHLIILTKCKIYNNTKKIKLTLYYVIIRIANFKQCICTHYNKACSITSSNGACNK